jgi:predicted RNase H-like HicB family nuclease
MKITKDGKMYVAVDEETKISAKGMTRKEAERKLQAAIERYFDKLEFKPEFVKRIKNIEKNAKFIHVKNMDEWFRKIAEEG